MENSNSLKDIKHVSFIKNKSLSKEEVYKMNDEKEQLFRDVNPKKHLEESLKKVEVLATKEKAEEVIIDIVEDKPVEVVEKPAENSKKSSSKKNKSKEKLSEESEEEEVAEEETEEDEKELVKEEIIKTKEELSVLKEARDELVELYTKYSDLKVSSEALSKENSTLKVEMEQLTAELGNYKEIEKQRKQEEKLSKLKNLSAKFKALGQIKTVEQLSAKDDEIIEEFEKITDAALDRIKESSEAPTETVPTQVETVSEASRVEEKSSDVVAENGTTKESLSDKKFFSNLCTTLTGDQAKSGTRIKFL